MTKKETDLSPTLSISLEINLSLEEREFIN